MRKVFTNSKILELFFDKLLKKYNWQYWVNLWKWWVQETYDIRRF